MRKPHCLSLFGLLEQNITERVPYKQQTLIVQGSGSPRSGASMRRSAEGLLGCRRLTGCVLTVEGAREFPGASFIRTLNLHPHHLITPPPKTPPPYAFTWGIRFQHVNLWGDANMQSIAPFYRKVKQINVDA